MEGADRVAAEVQEAVIKAVAPRSKWGAGNGGTWCYRFHQLIGLINKVANQLTKELATPKTNKMQSDESWKAKMRKLLYTRPSSPRKK